MFRVLLVYPNIRYESLIPPSLALLSRILKNEGFVVDIFDTTGYEINLDMVDPATMRQKNLQVIPSESVRRESKGDVYAAFIEQVQTFSPDLIAVTSTESTFLLATSILSTLGTHRPRTILGGVFATFAPELALRYPEIDMCLCGEGEHSLPELCHKMASGEDYTNVRGLAYKDKGGRVHRNPLPRVTDINCNPTNLDIGSFPDHRLYRPLGFHRWRMLSVETHRGCPYTCSFCNSPAQNRLADAEEAGKFFRKKSPEKTREEILYYRDTFGIDFVFFWADTFFAWSPREFDAFCEMYQDIKLPFWCQTRAETIRAKPGRVKQLKDIGLYWISFGLEHGNYQFRKDVVDRECDNDEMVRAFDTVNSYDVPLTVNNIIGFPDETRELAFDTVEINRRFKAGSRSCSILMPYQGTAIHRYSVDRGYIANDTICPSNNDRAIMNMSTMSKDEIMGLSQTFVLYVAFPKHRWPEIKLAEAQTDDGERRREGLRQEYLATYHPDAYRLGQKPTIADSEPVVINSA